MPAYYARPGRTRAGGRLARSPQLAAELAARLTARDRWLLRMICEHRVLTTGQVTQLAFGTGRAATARMTTLYQYRAVDRFRPLAATGSSPLHFILDEAGAMLFGRTTYELMEGAWPAVVRDEQAPRVMRDWGRKLEAKPKYVVSTTRRDFPSVLVHCKHPQIIVCAAVARIDLQRPPVKRLRFSRIAFLYPEISQREVDLRVFWDVIVSQFQVEARPFEISGSGGFDARIIIVQRPEPRG